MNKKILTTENGNSNADFFDPGIEQFSYELSDEKKVIPKKIDTPPRVYYDGNPMLRYNPLWAIILGERSVGKSFWFKRKSVVTPNSIWVYLRRTDVLRKDPKNWKSYLSDLLQAEVIDPDREYKVNSEGLWVDGMQKVIFSALSTDSSAHSMTYLPDSMDVDIKGEATKKKYKKKKEAEVESNDDVVDDIREAESTFDTRKPIKKYIVFEEIIEPTNRYLKNEVEQLFEFYNTVDRYSGTQLFGIANLMSTYNPYFEYFGIKPFREEFKWFKDKTLLVQNVKLQSMEDFIKGQRFYNLVKGTSYADYLTNNTPWQDDNYGIELRPSDSKLVYNIRYDGILYGIWNKENIYYVSLKNNPQFCTYSSLKSMEDDDLPIRKGDGAFNLLNKGIENGIIRFDSISIREMVFDIIAGGYKEK